MNLPPPTIIVGLKPLLLRALVAGEVLECVQHGLGVLLLLLLADLGLLK